MIQPTKFKYFSITKTHSWVIEGQRVVHFRHADVALLRLRTRELVVGLCDGGVRLVDGGVAAGAVGPRLLLGHRLLLPDLGHGVSE